MDESTVVLLCLPFAGSGASFYHPWRKLAPAGLEVRALQLPGRERLIDEEPYTDLHAAAEGLVPAALAAADGRPVALFGHCLGAILAFELAERLAGSGSAEVLHLFVSASRAPWDQPAFVRSDLSDDDLLCSVNDLTGFRHQALDVPEMRELLMPALRADVRMLEDYRPRGAQRLDVPVTAYYGDADDLVPGSDCAGWARATSREFEQVEMVGGHMYVADSAGLLLPQIARSVAREQVSAEVAPAKRE